MNIVSSILNRYTIKDNTKLNIIWTNTYQEYFAEFIESMGHQLITLNNLYFQGNFPHLIICNDRFTSHEKIKALSIEYHLPVIVVDHEPKQSWIDDDKIKLLDDFPCAFKIATNNSIYKSWKELHDIIMPYKLNDKNSINEWNTILHKIAIRVFTV
jgi:hypothetical protein